MGFLDSANNLNDVASIASAVANLGLAGALEDVNIQVFDTPGAFTYTPNAKMSKVWIWLQAGGGGSGGTTGAAMMSAAGGSGGGGGFLWLQATAAQIGSSISGSIGDFGAGGASGANIGSAGGNTSVTIGGSPWVATGGLGGSGQTCSASAQISGAAAGAAFNAPGSNAQLILNLPGQHGSSGFSNGVNTAVVLGAAGGDAFLGHGGHSGNGWGNEYANPYGGGAGGGVNCLGANKSGMNGAHGIAIVIEFCTV